MDLKNLVRSCSRVGSIDIDYYDLCPLTYALAANIGHVNKLCKFSGHLLLCCLFFTIVTLPTSTVYG